MTELIAAYILGGLIFGFIGLLIGEPKGRSGAGFALGFFLWVLGLIIAAFLPVDDEALAEEAIQSGKSKRCEHCFAAIPVQASVCRYCSRDVAPYSPPKQKVEREIDPEVERQLIAEENKAMLKLVAAMLVAIGVPAAIYYWGLL